MKKTFTLIIVSLLSVITYGQVAITLNSADIPVPTAPFNVDQITTTSPAAPTLGDNQTWDYSSNFGNTPLVNAYPAETDVFFTSAGIDVKFDGMKSLNSTMGYYVSTEYDFNTSGIYEAGANINLQGYSLSTVTGGASDSMIFPAQQYIFTTPKTLMTFPCTQNSSWHSVSSRHSNFNLTVAAYFLNHTPGVHAYTFFRNDTIVGWGKVTVYTAGGPSISYDVLMDKVEQFAVDSFYLNGSPAPAPLLTAFQVTQGQHTDVQYSYNFYRAGSFNYLLRFNYGLDNTYTNLAAAYVNTDNITTAVEDVKGNSYSTLVYPNPSNGNDINVKVIGQKISLTDYSIIDQLGNIVQQGTFDGQNTGSVNLSLKNNLANGQYVIRIKDKNKKEVVSEKITKN